MKSASEWVVDKLISSQETLTKFVVFAHHKTVLDLLQEASKLFDLFLDHRAVVPPQWCRHTNLTVPLAWQYRLHACVGYYFSASRQAYVVDASLFRVAK